MRRYDEDDENRVFFFDVNMGGKALIYTCSRSLKLQQDAQYFVAVQCRAVLRSREVGDGPNTTAVQRKNCPILPSFCDD